VLLKSFELSPATKIPYRMLESMRITNYKQICDLIFCVYFERYQEVNNLQKEQCAENVMYIMSMVPAFLYSNTGILREVISKEKRCEATMKTVETHLVVKELAKEGFKLINSFTKSPNELQASTFMALNASGNQIQREENAEQKQTESSDRKQGEEKPTNKEANPQPESSTNFSIEFEESFITGAPSPATKEEPPELIPTELIKNSLQDCLLLASPL
jgi:hypothetical protein